MKSILPGVISHSISAYRAVKSSQSHQASWRWMSPRNEATLALLRYGHSKAPRVEYGYHGGTWTQFELTIFFD